MLGQALSSISKLEDDQTKPQFQISFSRMHATFTSEVLLTSVDFIEHIEHLPDNVERPIVTSRKTSMAFGIVVIAQSISQPFFTPRQEGADVEDLVDSAMMVYPPGELKGGDAKCSVFVLVTSDGMMSTPKGECASYIALHND